ncbi:MAG: Gfo/Idh/MocA family oxidoreductase [Chloroflexota bacterium]|nr:Gfo/Idh/MocA family oxidoreductase [Chloroflexota bacterium]
MADPKLRWGILSTGRIGIKALLPAIRESQNGVVAAIASRDLKTAQDAAKANGIPRAFGSYDALLESPDIDAVYIPLPNSLHKDWTIRAAERGKHVLCEKPFALNASEVDEMIAAAKQHRVLLMEAFMYRFHPQFAQVQELIARGAIGAVQIIRCAFCFYLDNLDNIRLKKDLGGGALMDVGCYCVNMARGIAGAEPLEVRADAVIGETSQVDETLTAILRFPKGIVAHFDASFRTDYREWLDIQGSEGRIELPRPIKPQSAGGGEFFLYHGEDCETIVTPFANHYQLMVEHFADAVMHGTPLRYPPELDRANMRVIDALYESARTGQTVNLPANLR